MKQFDISAVVGRELECCKQLINTVECEEHLHESLTVGTAKEYTAENPDGNGLTRVSLFIRVRALAASHHIEDQ